MKPVKFVVLIASLLAAVSVFTNWIAVEGTLPKLLSELPTSGMQNGGAVVLFFLFFSLLAAGLGIWKRFGRGLAFLSLFGSVIVVFFAMLKFGDIDNARLAAKQLGVTLSPSASFWLLPLGSVVTFFASVVGLIKPEKKPAPPIQAPGPQAYYPPAPHHL